MTGRCYQCGVVGEHDFWPTTGDPSDVRCLACGWLAEAERIVEAETERCDLPLWIAERCQ